MRQLLKWMRWAAAAAVVTMLVLLAWQCIDIYLDGLTAADIDIYRWDDVCARIQSIAVPLVVCSVICILAGVLNILPLPDTAETASVRDQKSAYKRPRTMDRLHIVRVLILCAAIGCIVLGALNGGLRDVLIKAINICTECIGLG